MLRFICCVSLAGIIWNVAYIPLYQNVVLATMLYLLTGGWKWLQLISKTIKRDVDLLKAAVITARRVKKMSKKYNLLTDVFFERVEKQPDKMAYISADTGKTMTFRETEQLILKIANLFYASGYKKGDVIVLLMENRIEYIPIWLGLSMLGVVTSLINYNLRGDSLTHCIAISKCKAIIFSEEMAESIKEIEKDLQEELYCFDHCDCNIRDVKYVTVLLESVPALKPPTSPEITFSDPLLYMYTSGTTGLPKASIVRSEKILNLLTFANVALGVGPNDVVYNTLPLYHANGSVASCHTIVNGSTIVIKKKFSASRYMEDCCKYKVTNINYIGETCRYLLAQPKREFDHTNDIRLASGNGLRASIWKEFKERFRIKQIVEVYGATEGNIGLINLSGRVGAVGYSFIAFPFLNSNKIIKVDKDTGEVIRGENGLAIQAKPGEHGQIVGVIQKKPMLTYDGYLDRAETQKKIERDIFRKGDSVFLSGDILVTDEEGYFYFQDRKGDTFRWRGENVSTNEVEGIISKAVNLTDVVVYGTEIPGEEGKAGMACFYDPEREIHIGDLQRELQKDLPRYAQPIFLRMTSTIDMTGTFKLQKNKLREEGYNMHACPCDDFYYLDPKEKKYMRLDAETLQRISDGCLRF